MYKCWERYGNKRLKPKMVEQHLNLFMRTQKNNESPDEEEHIWVLVPLVTVSQHQGLPTLMEGSHRKAENYRPYNPIVQPGSALMFDARLKTCDRNAGGGVVFARAYDVNSKS